MKKILLMAAVAMMTAMSVQAQNNGYETKHEVAVSYGIDSNSQIIDVFEETEDGGQRIVYCSKPVYSLYPLLDVSCEDKHGDYKVVGISMGVTTSILIRKES